MPDDARIIIAFDFETITPAKNLLDKLDPKACKIKIGSAMFTQFGTSLVKEIINKGFEVFLDLKFFDIPNTVHVAARAACELGVWMFNVHALGGARMMSATREAIEKYSGRKPLLTAVTLLTSFSKVDIDEIGLTKSPEEHVLHLAMLAKQNGCDGVVCSANEADMLKKNCGDDFCLVTPGIRLEEDTADDQRRVVTPARALQLGVDYMVIGRSITRSADPAATLKKINEMIAL